MTHTIKLQGIKKRSFSLLLARRYLNPRRALLSSFTLISVIGVMLGVLVLVVVMAVFSGLERQIKERILGFTPHILVQEHFQNPEAQNPDATEAGWEKLAGEVGKLPQVRGATPYISDHVIIDVASWQRPAKFHSIDSSDPAQIEGLRQMLDLKQFPASSADIGIDDRAVISSILAEQYGIGVGSMIRLYSTRNFEQVMRAYKSTENPPMREYLAPRWNAATGTLNRIRTPEAAAAGIPQSEMQNAYQQIVECHDEDIRQPERELLHELILEMESGYRENGNYKFAPDAITRMGELIDQLNSTDAEEMDADILKAMKSFVLPKELEVIGVYQASQMAMTPDIFVPLHIGQDLAGLEDQVQGIALRLDDAYRAEQLAASLRQSHGQRWSIRTWGEDYQAFFLLMGQQRVMMYFALSFIVLVSAFSMMAVMFTVTVQKKREIGVMKALGAAPGQIVRVFLYQGMLLGAIGALIGIGLGHLVIHFRGSVQAFMRALGFDPFSASLTGFDTLPAHHNPVEQILIGFCAFVLCSLAALVPAFFAARSDAAKSLRNL